MCPHILLHYGFHVVTVLVLPNDNQDALFVKIPKTQLAT